MARFGSLRRIYELLGYQPSSRQLRTSMNGERTRNLRASLLRQIEVMFPGQVTRTAMPGTRRLGLQVKDGPLVSVLVCLHYRTKSLKRVRWNLIPYRNESHLPALVCLSNAKHDGFNRLYLFPRIDKDMTAYQIKSEADSWLRAGEKMSTLDEFCYTVRRIAAQSTLLSSARAKAGAGC